MSETILAPGAFIIIIMFIAYMMLGSFLEKYHCKVGHEASIIILIGSAISFSFWWLGHEDFNKIFNSLNALTKLASAGANSFSHRSTFVFLWITLSTAFCKNTIGIFSVRILINPLYFNFHFISSVCKQFQHSFLPGLLLQTLNYKTQYGLFFS